MGARTKLNQFFIQGALVIAGIAGLISESWMTFFAALGAILLLHVHSGNIRINSPHDRLPAAPPPRRRGSSPRH